MKELNSGSRIVGLLTLTLLVAACEGPAGREAGAATPSLASVVEPADIAVARVSEIRSGPTVSGSLQAATEAAIRAELAGRVALVYAAEGQRVARGAVLARIDDPTLGEQQGSAQAAISSAEIAVQNARRNVERYETLVEAGAAPRRDLENARSTLAAAEAQLSSARSQGATVQKSVADATVRSPIAGIVSAKSVSQGDVVQMGAELFKVVDPSSMRLEASVPSEQLASLKVGDPVQFSVRGYTGRTFAGRIDRISPTADPATRQVRIFVSVPNPGGALVAGLFAEGRITTAARQGLMVPASAVQASGGEPFVMRLRDGSVEQAPVRVGLSDETGNQVEIASGLAAGDTLLVGPAMEIAAGTTVHVRAALPVAPASR